MIIYKKAITITWICCYVHSVHIPKQTNRMKVDVLNRVFILRVSCLKQGHGFKPSVAQLYSNTGQEPPQDSGLSLFCILFYHTNPTLLCPLPQSSSMSMSSRPSTSTCPTLYPSWSYTYLAFLSFDLHQLFDLSGLCEPVHKASLLFPTLRCNLIWFEYRSRSLSLGTSKFLHQVRTSSWTFQRQWLTMANTRRLFSLHQSVHQCWFKRKKFNYAELEAKIFILPKMMSSVTESQACNAFLL